MGEHFSYWQTKLEARRKPRNCPMDRPRPRIQSLQGASISTLLNTDMTEPPRDSRREGATLFMVLLACFKALLHCTVEEEDVVVGTDVAGRNRLELESLWMLRQSYCSAYNSGRQPRFRELMARVRQVTLEAYAHQDVPFNQLVEVLEPERDPALLRCSRSCLSCRIRRPRHSRNVVFISIEDTETYASKYDLGLFFSENPDGTLQAHWLYRTDLFDARTVRQMARAV